MLSIGIDATAIPLNRAGAGNYIFNLVRSLATLDTTNRYVVFAKRDHIDEWKIDRPNFQFVASTTLFRPLRLLWEQAILPFLVRKYELDVLHSPHYTIPLVTPSRSVVTFHDLIFFLYPEVHTFSKRFFFQTMMRAAAHRADRIIADSESTAKDLLRIFPQKGLASRVHTIPLAVSEHFRPIDDRYKVEQTCQRYAVPTGKYVLNVGVLEPRKNIPLLLLAYRDLADKGISAPLVIVGKKGWRHESIFSTARTLKLENRVVFTGYVPDEDLPFLYNGARVFVYPSIYEGFGLPVLEALACGAPVVTSCVSSMSEIAGEAAVLVDPHDAHQLSRALEGVITDDDLQHSLRERSLQQAARFSWQRTARETIQVYELTCREHL